MTGLEPPLEPSLAALRASERPALVLRPEPVEPPRSIALLAGSFDPLTIGHAAMAEAAAGLADLVVLVYSVRTLPKEGDAPPALLGETARIRSLEAFCAARPGRVVGLCSHGLLADQVAAAAERFPGVELVVVVGSDKLLQLLDPRWYEDLGAALGPMFERASVAYATRAGDEEAVAACLAGPATAAWRSRISPLDLPPRAAAASSRRVRELLARGGNVDALVPREIRPFLPSR